MKKIVNKSELEAFYQDKIVPDLKKNFGLNNPMEVPRIKKIVINTGIKEASSDSKYAKSAQGTISNIAGQKAVLTKAKQSIAGFKIRKGLQIGVMVTLRRKPMYEFLNKLVNVALPCVRDFRGVKPNFDGMANYNLGIKDWTIFPEVDFNLVEGSRGINITIVTTAKNDVQAKDLLTRFGLPFVN